MKWNRLLGDKIGAQVTSQGLPESRIVKNASTTNCCQLGCSPVKSGLTKLNKHPQQLQ
ncbi:hypothetical protein M5D96_003096, partial [Drosophila gunungcola]